MQTRVRTPTFLVCVAPTVLGYTGLLCKPACLCLLNAGVSLCLDQSLFLCNTETPTEQRLWHFVDGKFLFLVGTGNWIEDLTCAKNTLCCLYPQPVNVCLEKRLYHPTVSTQEFKMHFANFLFFLPLKMTSFKLLNNCQLFSLHQRHLLNYTCSWSKNVVLPPGPGELVSWSSEGKPVVAYYCFGALCIHACATCML